MANRRLRPACGCCRYRAIRPGTWASPLPTVRRWPSMWVTLCITRCRSSIPNGRRCSMLSRGSRAKRAARSWIVRDASARSCFLITCRFLASGASRTGAGTPSTTEAADVASIERQLELMERSVAPRPPGWTWILVGLGLLLVVGLGAHAATAYATIDRIDQISRLDTPNPVTLLEDLAVNGTRVSASIDANNRGAYARAISQYVLDGTGVCLGVALAFGGLFVRI